MSDWKGIVKRGWHPEKEGTTFKGQVSDLFGRGDKQNTSSHATRPISELRDPSSFGPPPKRKPNVPLPPPPPSSAAAPQTDTPSTPIQQHDQQVVGVSEIQPKPWKIDSTGLSTSHLPPPPSRRDGADANRRSTPPPLPYSAALKPSPGGPPSLPPRLPPRTPSTASASSPQPPASQQPGYVNQAAVNRIGQAGITVPALGIGKRPTVPVQPIETHGTSSASTSSSQAPPLPSTPQQGIIWAQKQAALRTASNSHKYPSSVSLSDARTAANTANNFHERHGEQIAGGLSAANRFGQKFGVTEKVKAGFGNDNSKVNGEGLKSPGSTPTIMTTGEFSQVTNIASTLCKKKSPPPLPPKKTALSGTGSVGEEASPPPVPLSTRPKFYHGMERSSNEQRCRIGLHTHK